MHVAPLHASVLLAARFYASSRRRRSDDWLDSASRRGVSGSLLRRSRISPRARASPGHHYHRCPKQGAIYLDSHAYLIKRSHARAIVEAHDVLVNGSTDCRNPWYDADVEANTCSLDPSLLYGAFRACTLPGTSCAGLALGTKSSHNLVVHGSGGKDNKDQHRDAKRL